MLENKVAVSGLQRKVPDRMMKEVGLYIEKLGNREQELAEVTQENAKRLDSLQYKAAKNSGRRKHAGRNIAKQ